MTGVLRHPHGPRVYVAGRRVHHGSAGAVLAILGARTHRPILTALGLVGVIHDRADFPWRDDDNHPSRRSR